MSRFFLFSLLLLLSCLLGCSHWRTTRSRCNPLGGGRDEDCFLPFPSSVYLKKDSGTRTGLRVDLSQARLPQSIFGTPLDPEPYQKRDGFSAAAPLLAYFPTPVDGGLGSGLPDLDHPARSLKPDSPVQLLEWGTGKRVAVFAELDANADPNTGEKQLLILRPIQRLRGNTRYVAVVQGLRSRDGREIEPLSGFKKIRDKTVAPDSELAVLAEKYEGIFSFLKNAGLERRNLQLAWDFTTGSDESITERLIRMRDQAWEARTEHPGHAIRASHASHASHAVQVNRVEEQKGDEKNLWRRLLAEFWVPSFLVDGNGSRLVAEDAEPKSTRFPLTIHVPRCAKTAPGPLPVLIYGHGTFSSAEREMNREYSREMANRLCVIEVGTDWLGRAQSDLLHFLFRILPDWNQFPVITDRLQQAHINVLTLAHLIREGALNPIPELRHHGKSLVDPQRIYYLGISEGGCQGATTLALSPDISRGALNVPCGFWSTFFSRSSDFHVTGKIQKLFYPDPAERQEMLALSQLLWDYTDPANFGPHLLRDPLAGSSPKKILYQEGINDASVPNLTTRMMARTIGLKLIGPPIESVEGIAESTESADSGYVQFDVGASPRLGANNIPPPVSLVHEEIRQLEAVELQFERFFREDGKVENTCAGKPCVFKLH